MDIRYHSTVIFTADVEAAKRFYCAALGLEIDMDMREGNGSSCTSKRKTSTRPSWR